MEYFDITPEISEKLAVWPDTLAFRQDVVMDFKKGHNLVLSDFHTTAHVGAHVDAPIHYHPKGVGIGERSLDYYLGDCQVVSVSLPKNARILPADISKFEITKKRVLFKTGSFPDPNHFNTDFNSLSAPLIEFLASKGVILVGIDTPSVDPFDDKVLESHQALFKHDLANLEGVVLKDVPDGEYTLLALQIGRAHV